ncbi:multicopper oxidase domain-containing protein [Aestuariimicrobium kwangyangense]|uniref:multicopper oxidase domain-containing protein n=1 Tax=Aestuariimicrobium kwangyangense TaxID=396389 RepID=UPI00047C7A7F
MPGPGGGPGGRPSDAGDRRSWHRRAGRPVSIWMSLLLVALVVDQFFDLRWLLVHMVTLGLVTNSIVVWGQHFAEALLRRRVPDSQRGRQLARLGVLNAGIAIAMVGMLLGGLLSWAPLVTLVGALAVAGAVLDHGISLVRQIKVSLPARFTTVVRWYATACVLMVLGTAAGATLAFGFAEPWAGRILLAHLAFNVLGFVATTAVATLITLWPTVLRTPMAEGTERAARIALPMLCTGVLLTAGGSFVHPAVAVLGLAVHLAALLLVGLPLATAALRKPPRDYPGYAMGSAFLWLIAADVALAVNAAVNPGSTHDLQRVTLVIVVGFGAQLLLGAMTYLMPTVMGGGPAVVRASTSAANRWSGLRWALVNAGLVVWLVAPATSGTRRAAAALTVLGLALFLPVLTGMVRAHVAARKQSAASTQKPTAGPKAAGPDKSDRDPATGTPSSDLARRDLLEATVGLGAIAAAVVIPALTTRDTSNVVPTGRTVTVAVRAVGMRFVPDTVTAHAGDRVVVRLTNHDDSTVHDLALATGESTGRLGPHQSGTLETVVGAETVEGWCTVAGHRAMGMVFHLVVNGSSSAAPAGGTTSSSERFDLTLAPGAGFVTRDPRLAARPAGHVHPLTLEVTEPVIEVAPKVRVRAMTYSEPGQKGRMMGPTIHASRGDQMRVHLVNRGSMGHSIDFHAGTIAPNQVMRTIAPGASLDYPFTLQRHGIWLYHCSTMPMSLHLASGMFGAVIVPPDDLAPADLEYLLVASETYLTGPDAEGIRDVSTDAIASEQPSLVLWNGHANQYVHAPLTARTGQRVRLWLLAAGPSRGISFHVVGGQFDTVYKEGAYLLRPSTSAGGGAQALDLSAAQGGFVELVFPEPGRYTFVSHAFVDAERGARGFIDVT